MSVSIINKKYIHERRRVLRLPHNRNRKSKSLSQVPHTWQDPAVPFGMDKRVRAFNSRSSDLLAIAGDIPGGRTRRIRASASGHEWTSDLGLPNTRVCDVQLAGSEIAA